MYEEVRKTESYEEFISRYIEKYVYVSDKKIVHEFLASESLEEGLVDGCVEKIFHTVELLEKIRMHIFDGSKNL